MFSDFIETELVQHRQLCLEGSRVPLDIQPLDTQAYHQSHPRVSVRGPVGAGGPGLQQHGDGQRRDFPAGCLVTNGRSLSAIGAIFESDGLQARVLYIKLSFI